MYQLETVTASLANNTPYTLTYQSSSQELGNFYTKNQTIAAGAEAAVFYAAGVGGGSDTGCEGAVVYNFTDGNGNTQSITLCYKDPFFGSNAFTVTCPSGMSGSANQPQSGSVVITYTVGGSTD